MWISKLNEATEKGKRCLIFPPKVSVAKLNYYGFNSYTKNYLLDLFKVLLLQYSPAEAP